MQVLRYAAVDVRNCEVQVLAAKIDEVVLPRQRPVRGKRVFEAAADRPAGAREIDRGDKSPIVQMGRVAGPCAATRDIEQRAIDRIAKPAGQHQERLAFRTEPPASG